MPPTVGKSLLQLKQMYFHLIEQIEVNNNQEQHQTALQMQQLNSMVTELEVQNQKFQMQASESRNSQK